jgi:hypothetical protein
LALGALAIAGCGTQEPSAALSCGAAAVVYGEDGRAELSARDPWRALGERAVVAILTRENADLLRGGALLAEHTAQAVNALCPDEPFAMQPALADCTGVLLAPDLLLTAGHCLRRGDACADYAYACRYLLAEDGSWQGLATDRWLSCEKLLLLRRDDEDDGVRRDYALVQLRADDAEQAEHEPERGLALRATPPLLNEPVVLIGHPMGLPMKIDRGGQVIEDALNAGTWFGADLDSFGGSSGAPVFDVDGMLLGIAVAGLRDYEYLETPGCFRSNVVSADRESGTYERVASITSVLRDACAEGIARACALLEQERPRRETSCPGG